MKNQKLIYSAPTVDVLEIELEQGIAQGSGDLSKDTGVSDTESSQYENHDL